MLVCSLFLFFSLSFFFFTTVTLIPFTLGNIMAEAANSSAINTITEYMIAMEPELTTKWGVKSFNKPRERAEGRGLMGARVCELFFD